MLLFSQNFSTRRCILILVVLRFALADEKRSWKEILHTEIDKYKCLDSSSCSDENKEFVKDQITQQMTSTIGKGFLDSVDGLVRDFHGSVATEVHNYLIYLSKLRHAQIYYYTNERLIRSESNKNDLTLIKDILRIMEETLDEIESDGNPSAIRHLKTGVEEQDPTRQEWCKKLSHILYEIVASVDPLMGVSSSAKAVTKTNTINSYKEDLKAVDPESTLVHSKKFYRDIINAYIGVFRKNESQWLNKETRNEWELSQYYNDDIQPVVENFKESLSEPPNKS